MSLASSSTAVALLDFGIPVKRYPMSFNLDEPIHFPVLLDFDRRRMARLRHRILQENEDGIQSRINVVHHESVLDNTPSLAPESHSEGDVGKFSIRLSLGDFDMNWEEPPMTRPQYDYCAPIRLETSSPDETRIPYVPMGDSLCWLLSASPEEDPEENDRYPHQMLLDLGSDISHLYHTGCTIRSPFPAEDPWPSDITFNPQEMMAQQQHLNAAPRYVRVEEPKLVLVDPELFGATPRPSKCWVGYADQSKYLVQTYTFKKFYFHGYVRPNHIVVPKRSKLVYAEAQDVNLGLNLSANQTGVESDLKNNLDGLMGLGIPRMGTGSLIERLCQSRGNQVPGFLLYLSKKSQSYLVINPSTSYLHTISPTWSNHIVVDPSLLANHWFVRMQSVTFLNEGIKMPPGPMGSLTELDSGSTYCYLHQDIFLPLSQKANMVYKEDKGIYYLPANYLKNPTPLRVTVATSARPFTLDIPLGPAEGPVREIDGEPCVVSYFQPQTLEADELGLAGNVFGSVFFYYYSIYFALQAGMDGGGSQSHPTIRISALHDPDGGKMNDSATE